jgi:hypothetical protein
VFSISEYLPYFVVIDPPAELPPGGSAQFISPDPQRPLLYVTVPAGYTLWMSPGGTAAVGDAAIVIVGPQTYRLSWLHDGPLPTLAWVGYLEGAGPGKVKITQVRWIPPSGAPQP